MMIDTRIAQNVEIQVQPITPDLLRQLRQELAQSLSEFGLTLKRGVDPRAAQGYTRQYISRLEHGLDPITPELAAACWNIAAALDDVPAGIGGAVTTSILSQPGQVPTGSYLPQTAVAIRCARPGCRVIFIRTSPRQRYHHPDCRKACQAHVK